MADQLLDQVRELSEGQIVCANLPIPNKSNLVLITAGLRGSEAGRTVGNCSACNSRGRSSFMRDYFMNL
jgi:hypothetical protein